MKKGLRTLAQILMDGAERGFALVIALISIVLLTIMGVSAITTSTIDVKVAHNLKRYEQAYYSSLAGLEHAKKKLQDHLPSFTTEYDTEYNTYIEYGEDGSGEAYSLETAHGYSLGRYDIEARFVKCGLPPAGYSVTSQDIMFRSDFFDMKSTGYSTSEERYSAVAAKAITISTLRKLMRGKCIK